MGCTSIKFFLWPAISNAIALFQLVIIIEPFERVGKEGKSVGIRKIFIGWKVFFFHWKLDRPTPAG